MLLAIALQDSSICALRGRPEAFEVRGSVVGDDEGGHRSGNGSRRADRCRRPVQGRVVPGPPSLTAKGLAGLALGQSCTAKSPAKLLVAIQVVRSEERRVGKEWR